MLASILINNYNYGKYLEDCINSVLRQTYTNLEIIVYDDGSTDGSLSILEKYKERITIISNPNYGSKPNVNQMNGIYQAFMRSNGDVIFLLDSDDYFHNEKIGKIMNFLRENPNIDVVQHPLIEIDSGGKVKERIRPVLKRLDDYKEHIFSTQNLFHLFVSTSGLAFKRSIMNMLLPLEEDQLSYVWADTRLMLLSVLIGTIGTVNEPLSYYRIHGNNDSSSRATLEGHRRYTYELYEYFNKIALEHNYNSISFTMDSYLENSFFYSQLDFDRIQKILNCKRENCECWIWGAGEAGQAIFYALKSEGYSIKGFIDTNPLKKNEVIFGKKIFNPHEMKYGEDIKILISPYYAYGEISNYLKLLDLKENINYVFPFRKEG